MNDEKDESFVDYYMEIIGDKLTQGENGLSLLRVDYVSDRGPDSDFLNFAYKKYPELKEKKVDLVTALGFGWITEWRVDEECGVPFDSILIVFSSEKKI